MVLASLIVDSQSLFAALPVGEHNSNVILWYSIKEQIALVIVVLPEPGPPVIIKIRLFKADMIAIFCSSENVNSPMPIVARSASKS